MMVKQYLFGGPCDGKVVEVSSRLAALPVLTVANYSLYGEPKTLDNYELRPFERQDRRYYRDSRPYPRPAASQGQEGV